ncbi:unannotated protein [freshwater metagenome]|uniref:Unannotated protein n=1 Tax=freshwater metagenome TaxID=449393 RepID=A0A6J7CHA5_9ZZZZ
MRKGSILNPKQSLKRKISSIALGGLLLVTARASPTRAAASTLPATAALPAAAIPPSTTVSTASPAVAAAFALATPALTTCTLTICTLTVIAIYHGGVPLYPAHQAAYDMRARPSG